MRKTRLFITLLLTLFFVSQSGAYEAMSSEQEAWSKCANTAMQKYQMENTRKDFEKQMCEHIGTDNLEDCGAMVQIMAQSGILEAEVSDFLHKNIFNPACGEMPKE